MGIKIFVSLPIFLILFGGAFCSRSIVNKMSASRISDMEDRILINEEKYQLTIYKFDGQALLKNRNGVRYTSFPLFAQLDSYANAIPFTKQINWQVKGKEIIMLINRDGIPFQKIIIKPFSDALEINFGVKIFPQDTGIYLFKQGESGLNTEGWQSTFSPEPDDYYSSIPQIDVRVDRNQQWAFAPAPLNLSFKTEAGWFSIGLAQLPNASIFAYKDHAIYLDCPWNKFAFSPEVFYWIEPIVFTFNESPWQAVGDFQRYLLQHEYIKIDKKKEKNRPPWWSNPLVCTWGEQMVQNLTYDKDGYNSDWVRKYVTEQEKALDCLNFTLIIDDKWSRTYGDPYPDTRFKDLRQLIDWCHDRGHKVLLWWKAWEIEANSLAIDFNINDGDYVDATHPRFEAYIDSCCQVMLGEGKDQLDADGLKVDYMFLVRNPAKTNYTNPSAGMGIKELYHYMELLYKSAKKYKPNCLISGSAVDPHFRDVQDMIRINDDWDNKLRREKRARIITQAMPNMLIDGDAADMYNKIALYHYVTSSIYGVPSIYYLTQFHDGKISDQTKKIIADILKLSTQKPSGQLKFINYGNWRIVKDDEILAESLPQGKGIVIYTDDRSGTLLCTENTNVHLVLNRKKLKSVTDENGNKVEFIHRGQGIYELGTINQGGLYKLLLAKKSNIYE